MNLIGPDEAGARLGGIPARTLSQWRYLGRGPRYLKVGKYVRYRPEDIEAWLKNQTVETEPRSAA